MTDPLIPGPIATFYVIFAMLFVGFIVEEYYVGRITLFINSAALLVHANLFEAVSYWVVGYVSLGLGIGILGFIAYVTRESLPDNFYQFTYFAYSSAPVAVFMGLSVLFSPTFLWLIVGLLIGAIVNSKLLTTYPDHMAPAHRFDYPVRLAIWMFGSKSRH